jgi:hypothetical protein
VTRLLVTLALLASTPAHAEPIKPWYRGFYTRIGVRDSYGVQAVFHAWAAFAFGFGYRYNRDCWGLDFSVANVQFDPEEGMHTAARVVAYQSFRHWLPVDLWAGGGLSYGWVKGTVAEAIAKRKGEGFQAEGQLGLELPRALRVRMFLQFTVTVPLYHLRDIYKSRDSTLDVWAAEAALGVRF